VLTISGLGVGSVGSLRSISGVNEYAGNITLSGATPVRMNTDLNSLLISGNIIGGTTPLYFGSSASSGTVTTTVSGAISGAGGSLTWGNTPTLVAMNTSLVNDNNFLTLVLSGSNNYTGATVIGNRGVTNNNGGSGGGVLLLGASEVIANGSNIVFNGGVLNTGGNAETVGTISVFQESSSIVLGSGVHNLNFSGVGTLDYKTLTISGWQGTAGATGQGGDVYVGTSLFFTRAQLDQIKFTYNSGTFSAIQLSSGELVPDVNTVSNRSNIRITTGTTTNGSWSPGLGSCLLYTSDAADEG
jgi:hypothetical protein